MENISMLFGIGKVLSISESNKDKFQFDELIWCGALYENVRQHNRVSGDCQKVNCPEGAREATLGCALAGSQ